MNNNWHCYLNMDACHDRSPNSQLLRILILEVCAQCIKGQFCFDSGQFLLSNLGASSTSDPSELVEVASAENDVVIPSLSDIVTTYSIISPSLTSLTSLTTTSTLESVFNEPVMSVAVAGDTGETSSDITVESVLQS